MATDDIDMLKGVTFFSDEYAVLPEYMKTHVHIEKHKSLQADNARLREALEELSKLADNEANHTDGSLRQWVILLGRKAKQALKTGDNNER